MTRSLRRLFVVVMVGAAGCGGSSGSGNSDASAMDASTSADAAVTRDGSTIDGATVDGAVSSDGALDIDAAPAVDASPTDASPVDATPADAMSADAGTTRDASPDAGLPTSNIKHVVVVVQENHTFDNYFGRYCTAAAGSNPTCTTGAACCERAPTTEASGGSPIVLDDATNGGSDWDHSHDCEFTEINGGLMDRFVMGASCSAAKNFAISPTSILGTYHGYAQTGALADRYFQPTIGASSSNDMFFAVAKYVFKDNAFAPNAVGHGCAEPLTSTTSYTGQTTVADLLLTAGHSFAYYAMGFTAMHNSFFCPAAPSDCTSLLGAVCNYDPSDVPFEYYAQFEENGTYASSMRDAKQFFTDVTAGTLPDVSFIKAAAYMNEHPNFSTKITNGEHFVSTVVDAILGSTRYANDTLVLITWDEGGGFYDHVPTPTSPDSIHYGTRVPLIALGHFARPNTVSHLVMEHSSIVRFLELNFLGATGQLGARDALVNNIGSLLDPATTGIVIP